MEFVECARVAAGCLPGSRAQWRLAPSAFWRLVVTGWSSEPRWTAAKSCTHTFVYSWPWWWGSYVPPMCTCALAGCQELHARSHADAAGPLC